MKDRPHHRRSLTHVGGAIETEGDPRLSALLAHALRVAPSSEQEESARVHVHGFHTYPARMHPDTAARLVEAFSSPGGRVLDPFCGSGTVLVEALIQGRSPLGIDLNPLAVRLARCKTRPRGAGELARLANSARECARYAEVRRHARAGASRRFHPEDMRLFEPHVLLELDSLRSWIESLRDAPARLDLSLVLSAILVKLSRKRGDTSREVAVRRTAPGFPSRLFMQKTEDLAQRFASLSRRLPSAALPPVAVEEDNATQMRSLQLGQVDAIVTSPPYAATYDYAAHHDLRLRWLGLDGAPFARAEMGARSTYERIAPGAARQAWAAELGGFFRAAHKVLTVGGAMVLLIADSAVGSAALRADEIVAAAGRAAGFLPEARASQNRPHFHAASIAAFRSRPRAEHALLLRKT